MRFNLDVDWVSRGAQTWGPRFWLVLERTTQGLPTMGAGQHQIFDWAFVWVGSEFAEPLAGSLGDGVKGKLAIGKGSRRSRAKVCPQVTKGPLGCCRLPPVPGSNSKAPVSFDVPRRTAEQCLKQISSTNRFSAKENMRGFLK